MEDGGRKSEITEPAELTDSVSYRIRLLQIAAYKSFERVVAGHGTAPRYFGLLKMVEANPGISQARLAEAIFLDRSSLVPILETLTREGWIERHPCPNDKRVRQVFLTGDGRTRLARLEHEVLRHEAMMTTGLSAMDRTRLLQLLSKIDGNLRSAFSDDGNGDDT
ncbi:MarR family winged helix-turn-helix transcriptional regulator [Chachezhania sediminis]|uniref:MarR family winged helix-turn-helix transcriptional regulator n=1 Tax=Chachezhania sediminis TaxID=2599291 RepID=UPI00131D3A98|nr:MarR family transcriptional regulator [Chachezhania sediminis]